ncbi:hypothetical protein [Pedobacter gandavensis]|uniref:hypothetical protein n=1 Tax=Pedobacter gandavensis TaxID=2679963 RepID=UPI00292DF1F9|nr:hypothetical protein [Pedobacter gandavensis]
MGSTGSGTFSDYSNRKPKNPEDNNGGESGFDKCGIAFSCNLEEVSRCVFFKNHTQVPLVGVEINISFNGTRLVAETNIGEEIGYLPTKYNYLLICMEDNFSYTGVITNSKNIPTPSVAVDIIPG